jgi:uncharacterized protein YcbX
VSDAPDIVVVALATTPVKGMRVQSPTSLELGPDGVADDRRFYLVDERGRLMNGKHVGMLPSVEADYAAGTRTLVLTLPDGSVVDGTIELGEPIDTRFFSRAARARPVLGPWSQALSDHFERPLRLVENAGQASIDRGTRGAVSLMSRASLAALAQVAGEDAVDARRFRMLVEVDGVAAHGEDEWIGRGVRIGAALVRVHGHVGRCSTTTRHPENGLVDLPVLDLLRSYRGDLDTTEPLAFGVYGEVLEGGRVAVGDAVVPEPA